MTTKQRYQLPGRDNAERESWNHIKPYEAPVMVPTPTDDDSFVDIEPVEPAVTITEAVPVRVVEFAREPDRLRRFTTTQFTVGPGQTIPLPLARDRIRVTLSNMDTANTVYIGHTSSVNASTGFPLGFGKAQPIEAHNSIYIHNGHDTDSIVVGVLTEYVTELQ